MQSSKLVDPHRCSDGARLHPAPARLAVSSSPSRLSPSAAAAAPSLSAPLSLPSTLSLPLPRRQSIPSINIASCARGRRPHWGTRPHELPPLQALARATRAPSYGSDPIAHRPRNTNRVHHRVRILRSAADGRRGPSSRYAGHARLGHPGTRRPIIDAAGQAPARSARSARHRTRGQQIPSGRATEMFRSNPTPPSPLLSPPPTSPPPPRPSPPAPSPAPPPPPPCRSPGWKPRNHPPAKRAPSSGRVL